MMEGYHQLFSQFAGNSVFRELDIPAPELAVDSGERMSSVPIKTNYSLVNRPRVVQPDARDIDRATIDGISQQLTEKNFPKSGWLGDYEVGL